MCKNVACLDYTLVLYHIKAVVSSDLFPQLDSFRHICYNNRAGKPRTSKTKGVVSMVILEFFLSVAASVIAYYICKWLDDGR